LADAEPYLAGGGATARVAVEAGVEAVTWSALPHLHEGGSPNVVGAHALATACHTLSTTGWDVIRRHEEALADRLRHGLAEVPGVRLLDMWGPAQPRIGVASFTLVGRDGEPVDQQLIATALAAEHGIGIRYGSFCAHLAVRHLVGGGSGGALRASIGLGTTTEHVERLLAALTGLLRDGPRWTYQRSEEGWAPVPDPRPDPELL
ncbi:aminotransferase class V-fold PLP-dependent enzyme, partial [Actinosynnema sp. NPDC023658]|uniref:aminotransferase class V-fold PLP-dependent enzyme n=1 Tax=Actinosynnema sp. NPDC023658 TaxID=3155465 RepID=UPI0033CA0CFC